MEQVIGMPSGFAEKVIQENLRDFSWFLRDADMSKLEHNIEEKRFSAGSYYAETLWSGAGGKKNEDSYAVLPMGEGRTLFAVFDGASSQKKNETLSRLGMSGAFYLSHMVSLGFVQSQEFGILCRNKNTTAKDVMMSMNKWIHQNLRNVPGIDYSDIPSVPGMAAAFVLVDVSKRSLTISQVADAAIGMVKRDGSVSVITPNLNAKFDEETLEFAYSLAEKYGSDIAHVRQIPEANEECRQHLAESFARKTNKKGGCGILNGMPEMEDLGLFYSDEFSLDDGFSGLMMFSDGAIQPYLDKDISLSESARLLRERQKMSNGLSVLSAGVSILDNDPEFKKIPRLKHRDDATLLTIDFDARNLSSLPLAA